MKNLVFLMAVLGAIACVTTQTTRTLVMPPATCDGIHGFFQGWLEPYEDAVDEASKNYQQAQWLVETADPKRTPSSCRRGSTSFSRLLITSDVLERTKILEEKTRGLKPEECAFRPKIVRAECSSRQPSLPIPKSSKRKGEPGSPGRDGSEEQWVSHAASRREGARVASDLREEAGLDE